MRKRSAICNHSEHCMFYRNWLAAGDNRLNIIEIDLMENRDYFTCVALHAAKTGMNSGGIPMIAELASRVSKEDLRYLECPYLNTLNIQSRLLSGEQRD
jgi:hypothetical protein